MQITNPNEGTEERVSRIKRFNHMYMQRIGVMVASLFGGEFSMAEMRVLNELSLRPAVTAKDICHELQFDGGYLSRILTRFEQKGMILRVRSKNDARQRRITLTTRGREVAARVFTEAERSIMALLAPISVEDQMRLVDAMDVIDDIIRKLPASKSVSAK